MKRSLTQAGGIWIAAISTEHLGVSHRLSTAKYLAEKYIEKNYADHQVTWTSVNDEYLVGQVWPTKASRNRPMVIHLTYNTVHL